MGCDIHLYAEAKKNGKWQIICDKRTPREGWDYEKGGEPYEGDKWAQPYRGRNYDLFAVLAGVRNYAEIRPIAEPKGVPEDSCIEIRTISDEANGDGHSHSWLTLRELYANKEQLLAVSTEFVNNVFPLLARHCSDPTQQPDDVRIVFFFDN